MLHSHSRCVRPTPCQQSNEGKPLLHVDALRRLRQACFAAAHSHFDKKHPCFTTQHMHTCRNKHRSRTPCSPCSSTSAGCEGFAPTTAATTNAAFIRCSTGMLTSFQTHCSLTHRHNSCPCAGSDCGQQPAAQLFSAVKQQKVWVLVGVFYCLAVAVAVAAGQSEPLA